MLVNAHVDLEKYVSVLVCCIVPNNHRERLNVGELEYASLIYKKEYSVLSRSTFFAYLCVSQGQRSLVAAAY